MFKNLVLLESNVLCIGVLLFAVVRSPCLQSNGNMVVNPSFECTETLRFHREMATGATHGESLVKDFNTSLTGWKCPGNFGLISVHSLQNEFENLTRPRTGDICIGATLYAPAKDDHAYHKNDFVDFLVGSLETPTEKGQKYYVEFWFKNQKAWPNGERRTWCCSKSVGSRAKDTSHVHLCVQSGSVGMYFLPSEYDNIDSLSHVFNSTTLQSISPQFEYCTLINDSPGEWHRIQGAFIANTNSRHFIIGNFRTAQNTASNISEELRQSFFVSSAPHHKNIRDERVANYFFDDIIIRKATTTEYEVFSSHNCSMELLECSTEGVLVKSAISNYLPTNVEASPQRAAIIGNYDIAFTEKWPNCLSDFPLQDCLNLLDTGYFVINAKPFILEQALECDILFLNECHVHSEHRAFLFSLLSGLYDRGYRYLFLEALNPALSISEYNSPNAMPKVCWGRYTRDPVFREVLIHAKSLGFDIFPYEPNQQQIDSTFIELVESYPDAASDTSGWYLEPDGTRHYLSKGQLTFSARDKAMAQNIMEILKNVDKGKAIVYGGGGHVDATACGYVFPMKYWIDSISNYQSYSINQITSSKEAEFIAHEPSVIIDTLARRAFRTRKYCNDPREYQYPTDVTVLHAYYERTKLEERPDWLSLNGHRILRSLKLAPELEFPLVVAVYSADANVSLDLPIDAIEILQKTKEVNVFTKRGQREYKIVYLSANQIVSKSVAFN